MAEYVDYYGKYGSDVYKDRVKERVTKCKRVGKVYVPTFDGYHYVLPETWDHYDYEKVHPFSEEKNCMTIETKLAHKRDVNDRYFKWIKDKGHCEKLRGTWQENGLDRVDRQNRLGVCWRKPDDAKCGQQTKETCPSTVGCKWNSDLEDCVRTSLTKETDSVVRLPSEMPIDITTGDIAKFLYDYYVHGKYTTPPITSSLMGQGNRCKSGGGLPLVNSQTFDVTEHVYHRDIVPQYMEKIKKMFPDKAVQEYWEMKLNETCFDAERNGDGTQVKLFLQAIENGEALHLHNQIKIEKDPIPLGKRYPSLPQSIVNVVMKQIASSGSANRGVMAIHSTGSGKTCTATGVMDAFWDTDKQIVFVSSIDAITSNPPFKFHECAADLFPRFYTDAIADADREVHLKNVRDMFEARQVAFLPFAKLANRIAKCEEFKAKMGITKRQRGGYDDDIDVDVFKDPKPKPKRKTKQVVKEESTVQPKRKTKKQVVQEVKSPVKPKRTTKQVIVKVDSFVPPKRKTKQVVKEESPVPPKRKTKQGETINTEQETNNDYVPGTHIKRESNIGKLVMHVSKKYSLDTVKTYATLKALHVTGFEDYVDLDDSVLIIDEVHNLFRPLPNQRLKHQLVEAHLIDPKMHPNLKMTILTATPGDSVQELIKLLNMVRDPTHPPITAPDVENAEELERFKKSILGLISFFDMSHDTTLFPIVTDNAPIIKPMSTKQFERYVEAYKEVKADMKEYDKLAKSFQLAKYWQGARKYSNMLYNFEKGSYLADFSAKLPALLENIEKYPNEKQYIYSAFNEARGSSHGVLEIARQLERLGYTKLTVSEVKRVLAQGVLPTPTKRYILALQKEIGEEGGDNLAQLIRIFNHSENARGQLCQIFLATQGFNEGIDLKAVRHVHFFEPLLTMASDLQTIGRARRRCSHVDLDKETGEWSVQIHRYMSGFPADALVDLDAIEKRVQEQTQTRDEQERKVKHMKSLSNDDYLKEYGMKGVMLMAESRLETLNKDLDQLKKQLAVSKKNKRPTDVLNIDQFIRDNALQRAKQLFVLTRALQECAIDCRVLERFHNLTGSEKIACYSSK